MSDHFQTPFPTESSRSQVFVLKTTRPTSGGPLSPVPKVGPSKPAIRRVYARKKTIRHSVSSRNLKENSPYSRSGPGLEDGAVNLRTKLRARRTTSFASLKDQKKGGKSDKAGLLNLKSPSQVFLASPFCSRPASPDHGPEPPQTAKRTLATGELEGIDSSLPVSKRRNSNTPDAILPSPIPLRPSHSPAFKKSSKRPLVGEGDLHRRPSHPTLGVEGLAGRGDGRVFLLRSSPAIDFNRPPQLSLYAPLDGDDDEEGALDQRILVAGEPWVYNERFEVELRDTSTPNKRDPRLQNASLELLSSSPQVALTTSKAAVRRSPALEDRTLNMSLTSVEDNHLTEENELANRSPWISDSIISPPTIYLRREQADEGHGTSPPVYADKSSKALRTGEGDLTKDIGLGTNDSKEADGEMAVSRDVIPAETGEPRQLFGRTRSGTIVAPAPAVSLPATGRTRSGTITAASAAIKQGRGRSGTITQGSAQKALAEMKPIVTTGRTRSGTVTAARPQLSTVGALTSIPGLSGPEAHVGILIPEVDVHIDADYVLTPGEDLVFSTAPNPDLEAESDDELMLYPATISPAPAPDTGLRLPPSSPSDPSNIDIAKAAPNLNRASEDMEPEARANGKKPPAKRSGSKKLDAQGSKKLKLKMPLGFKSTRRGRKYTGAGEASTKPSPDSECDRISLLSSDPMDFVIGFNEFQQAR